MGFVHHEWLIKHPARASGVLTVMMEVLLERIHRGGPVLVLLKAAVAAKVHPRVLTCGVEHGRANDRLYHPRFEPDAAVHDEL
jgi:hypothetical protein